MDHKKAKMAVLEELVPSLMLVDSRGSGQEFRIKAIEKIQKFNNEAPDLPIGEILEFLNAAIHGAMAEMNLQGERAANLEAELAMVELNGQLMAARAVEDLKAERALLEEGTRRAQILQERMDSAARRIGMIMEFRRAAIDALADDLGYRFI